MLAAVTINATQALWAGLIAGVIAPPIITFLRGETWSPALKQFFSIAVSAVIACIVILITSAHWSASYLLTQTALITAIANSIYIMYFKSSPAETAIIGAKASLSQKK